MVDSHPPENIYLHSSMVSAEGKYSKPFKYPTGVREKVPLKLTKYSGMCTLHCGHCLLIEQYQIRRSIAGKLQIHRTTTKS